jgi:hypothetical protein
MFLGLVDPDTAITSKNSKKNFDSYCFVNFFLLLSLKNDVNVPLKSTGNKLRTKKWQDPDPLVRGMDPRIHIRIHTKMSCIRNILSCTNKNFFTWP